MRYEGERDRPGNLARRSPRPYSRSEFDFINSIRRKALGRRRRKAFDSSHIPQHSYLLCGIGDDAAVIKQRAPLDTVITADLLVEEIDFRLSTTTPLSLGHKALAVSLSDIAAMGASPRWALLSIGVPGEIWRSGFMDEFYAGFFALADHHGVRLIGGDTSSTPHHIVIDSIVIGEAEGGLSVLRSGARPGDHIFVTGTLGGSGIGLKLLERKRAGRSLHRRLAAEDAIRRHRRPEPRVAWGAFLGEKRLASAMIDISDGLSSDLSHLCQESGVGAAIDSSRIPISPPVSRLCEELGVSPLEAALDGGEDFELLFTVRPRDLQRLPRALGHVPATYIGDITYEPEGIIMRREGHSYRLRPRGYMHFD